MTHGRRGESGSALMLVPAGFLVLIVLASISVDSTIAYLARRQLENAITAAANDAATVAIPDGLGPSSLQQGDAARPDPVRAQQIVDNAVLHPYSGGLEVRSVDTVVDGDTVTVTATGTVQYIFARAVPGMRATTQVRAQSSSTLQFR